MTSPKGNSEFCFSETLNVPRGFAKSQWYNEGEKNTKYFLNLERDIVNKEQ